MATETNNGPSKLWWIGNIIVLILTGGGWLIPMLIWLVLIYKYKK